ncbi:unnamed protein product, partial [Ceratitis capitata]
NTLTHLDNKMRKLLLLLGGFFIILYTHDGEATKLLDIINTFNAKINATATSFFLNPYTSTTYERALRQEAPPKIIFSLKSPAKLVKELRNAYMLYVVFLPPPYAEQQQQLNNLLHAIGRISVKFFLFVSTEYQDTRWLFKWCWEKKILNALLTTNDTPMLLTTYRPFPHLQVYNTTADAYFEQFHKKLDLRGYPIRYTGGLNMPRSLIFKKQNDEWEVHGYLVQVFELFAANFNGSLQHVIRTENYTFEDCAKLTEEHQVDLCAELYPFGGLMHLSKPLHMTGLYILAPRARRLSIFYYFSAPFTIELWLLIALTFISLTAVLALMAKYRYSDWYFGRLLLNLVASFIFLPFHLRPFTGCAHCLLYIILFTTGFLFSTLYLAFLSSIFSADIDEQQISDVAGLKKANVSILIDETDVAILQLYNAPQALLERARVELFSVIRYRQLALDTRYAYLCIVDKCSLLMSQQKFMLHGKVYMITPGVMSIFVGVVMAKDTFFDVHFNRHLQRVFEAGIMARLQEQSKEEAIRLSITKYFPTEKRLIESALTLEYMHMPMMLMVIGFVMAFMVFCMELLIHRWRKPRANVLELSHRVC